jgi:hypothetical protein
LSSSKTCAVVAASVIVFAGLFPLPSQAVEDRSDFYKTLSSINKDSKKNLIENTATVTFSPSIRDKQKRKFQATVDSSLSFWSKETNLGNVSILFWSPSDILWAKQKYAEQTLGWNFDPEKLNSDIAVIDGKLTCVRSANETRYFKPFSLEPDLNHITRICVDDSKWTAWHWHVIAHEITHVWQFSAVRMNTRTPLWSWIIEGGAIYYGLSLSGIDQPKAKENIRHMYSAYFLYDKYGRSLLKEIKKDSSALVKFLDSTLPPAKYSEKTKNLNTINASYHVGSIVIAKIVEEYGQAKFVEFYNSLSTSNDYKENFKTIYGIDFYLFCEQISKDIFNQAK